MTTPKRPWCRGMMYHITTRGNRKELIFREENDFKVYLMFLKEALIYYKDFNYQIVCFCLMSNHVHLILKCNEKEPGVFMMRMNSKYTRYFNIKYEYIGHLFQGRYYADPITNINQVIETSKYIHLNPVKANIVKKPITYKWSTFNLYINESLNFNLYNNDYLLTASDILTDEVLQYFKSRVEYNEYVEGTPGVWE